MWGISGIEWDGEGPVMVEGRPWRLAFDPEWCDHDGLGPERWKGNSVDPDAPFPGFHFWVPMESGLWASVWIEKQGHAWLNWSRGVSIRDKDWHQHDIPTMRIAGTNLVQPQQYDDEIGAWVDPWKAPTRRARGRQCISWDIAGPAALGTPTEELREMLIEFGRYGKDPQITKYGAPIAS